MISATEEFMFGKPDLDRFQHGSSPILCFCAQGLTAPSKAGLIGSRPWQTMELQKAGAQPQLFDAAEAGTTMSLHRPTVTV